VKKNITREQVVETALELMKRKSDLRSLNLREIARTLGCAHTNLYNYFPRYNDLLWEAHAAVQEIFMETLEKKLSKASDAELRLAYFFEAFAETYLDSKGWFRLMWQEPVSGERTKRDIEATENVNKMMIRHISEIWKELSGVIPDADAIKRVLHNTHCYIVGEVSNYLSGRGLIENEAELKSHIIREAINIFKLCLSNPI
jgi:AcrR family transcriptional regulator